VRAPTSSTRKDASSSNQEEAGGSGLRRDLQLVLDGVQQPGVGQRGGDVQRGHDRFVVLDDGTGLDLGQLVVAGDRADLVHALGGVHAHEVGGEVIDPLVGDHHTVVLDLQGSVGEGLGQRHAEPGVEAVGDIVRVGDDAELATTVLDGQGGLALESGELFTGIGESLLIVIDDLLRLVLLLVDLAERLQLRFPVCGLVDTGQDRGDVLQCVVRLLGNAVEVADDEVGFERGDLLQRDVLVRQWDTLDVFELVVLPGGVLVVGALDDGVRGDAEGEEVVDGGADGDDGLRVGGVGVFAVDVVDGDLGGIGAGISAGRGVGAGVAVVVGGTAGDDEAGCDDDGGEAGAGERSGLVERAREGRSTEILRGSSVWGGHGQNAHGEDRKALDKGTLPSLSGSDRS